MKAKLESARVGLFTMIAADGRSEQEARRAMIKEVNSSIDSLFRALYDRNRDEPEITRLVEELERTYADYRDARDRQLLPLVYSGKKDAGHVNGHGRAGRQVREDGIPRL